MVKIILVMHEPLGHAFEACAEHVLGAKPELQVFDIAADDSTDEKVQALLACMRSASSDGTLILCDIYGATPFNIASKALRLALDEGLNGHLVTGTNLCMVLKALTAQQKNPEELSEQVRQGAVRGIVSADCALPP